MPAAPAPILVVMPAFNEEEVIGEVIAEVRSTLPEAHVVVVNDGSRDQTTARARAAGARVLELPFNLGVGGAMRLGFRFAQLHGYDTLVQVDSDGQHDPESVRELVAKLGTGEGQADVVIGARFAGTGTYAVSGPRKWAMVVLSRILSGVTGARLSDTTSGFKAHSARAIQVFANDYPAEYLGDTIEAIVIGHRAGLRFGQVAVSMRERAGGVPSHNAWKSAVYLGRAFLALVIAFLRPRPKR